jgi:hypothetical protein
MIAPYKLTLVPYLQTWDHVKRILSIRLLVAPTGNPLEPLMSRPSGLPAFADARFAFEAKVSDSIDALPQRTLVDQTSVLPIPIGSHKTISHPKSRIIFKAIKTALEIPDTAASNTFSAQSRDLTRQVRKYLPRSYQQSFPFVQPRTSLAVVDNTYHRLMHCPPDPSPPQPPTVIGWGEALALAMRRPRLAEALGLIFKLNVHLDPQPRLKDGGWLWVELASESDYFSMASQPGFVRAFATRVPPLPDEVRSLFTPVIFPVSSNTTEAATLGNFDKVFVEAVRFDDGFSKIVHSRQPLSSDPLDEDGTGVTLVRDEGIQLAWDDEDILEGQNRVLGAPPEGEDPVLAPRGVFGYRVDVRPEGSNDWVSLSKVKSHINVGVDLGTEIEERWSEVVPTEHSGQIWLPAWFLNWRGGSLVVSTPDEQRLMNVPPSNTMLDIPLDASLVELRYGKRYQFRVRMVDTTGGGPDIIRAKPVQHGESPIATIHMKRHRKPGIVEIDALTLDPDGTAPSLRIWRPKLGYPEAMYASGPSARTALLAQIAANDAGDPANATPPGIRDPDTAYIKVRVLIRAPKFDPSADKYGYVTWYETSRSFPSDPDLPLDLELSWQSKSDYRDIDISSQLGAEGTIGGPVVLATSRDVRLEVGAAGRSDMTYFASQEARLGRVYEIDFHAVTDSDSEKGVLATLPLPDALRSVFLRNDPIGERAAPRPVAVQNEPSQLLLSRLASGVELVADGPLLVSQEGERVAFGCSGLTHYIAPDSTSIELGEPGELADQWINVVQAVIDRDWTWRGASSPTLEIFRSVSLPDALGFAPETVRVGTIELMHTINVQAARNPERTYTRLVFVDALKPPLGPDGLPYEVEVTYDLYLALEGGGKVAQKISTTLPIATPPDQVPKVVAAGIALTPYDHDNKYATTGHRRKRLWIEFAEPLADHRDVYFVRPLTSAPDPMLLPGVEPVADPAIVEGTPLDPELVRVITPGQVRDLAGLAAMQRMEPASNSDRRFLMPLPPNTDPQSPELFSFFTYEIRVGHDRGSPTNPLWATAQGRFGEPLVLEGVQHPPPELTCSAIAEAGGSIRVRAPFATPYIGLRRVIPDKPNTQIWVVLFARVVQADASTRRNVQIALKRAKPLSKGNKDSLISVPLVMQGEARWNRDEIKEALRLAGFPLNIPITALAVEMLPEPNSNFSDPLGGDLGQVRILRTSPLATIERNYCMPDV